MFLLLGNLHQEFKSFESLSVGKTDTRRQEHLQTWSGEDAGKGRLCEEEGRVTKLNITWELASSSGGGRRSSHIQVRCFYPFSRCKALFPMLSNT